VSRTEFCFVVIRRHVAIQPGVGSIFVGKNEMKDEPQYRNF
jgi:hypothetical protein